jgi:hypothetical protein
MFHAEGNESFEFFSFSLVYADKLFATVDNKETRAFVSEVLAYGYYIKP